MTPPVPVVVLAAGGSRRLGVPKQSLAFRGRSLLTRALDAARAADCGPVFAVLGSGADALRGEAAGPGVTVVDNPDWAAGMGTSFRAAVAAVGADCPAASAILFTVCDQPLVTGDLLAAIAAAHRGGQGLVAAGYAGTAGVPALFARRYFAELVALPADAGAKRVLVRYAAEVCVVPFPGGAIDIDTPDDAARLAGLTDTVRWCLHYDRRSIPVFARARPTAFLRGLLMSNAPFDVDFWKTFHHGVQDVDGVQLHYVEGGHGKPVLLLPGWPQSWYAWRTVMPQLVAAGRRVIALDPRGVGDSDRPPNGYDLVTVAHEVHRFVTTAGLSAEGPIDVVGHDLGTWIGHAYAADWPDDVRRLIVFDAAIPGISKLGDGIPSAEANIKSWHLAFNRLDDLPELLIQGRERIWLSWLFRNKARRTWAIEPADLDEYVRVNSAPGALRAASAYYREMLSTDGLAQTRARADRKVVAPVLAMGAEGGVGQVLLETMRACATDVKGGVVPDCGHYMPEEAPGPVADAIIRFTES